MFDGISQALITLAISVITLFPQSPFRSLIYSLQDSALLDVFAYLNWLLPLNTFARILIAWTGGIAMMLIYQVILRWVRVIK